MLPLSAHHVGEHGGLAADGVAHDAEEHLAQQDAHQLQVRRRLGPGLQWYQKSQHGHRGGGGIRQPGICSAVLYHSRQHAMFSSPLHWNTAFTAKLCCVPDCWQTPCNVLRLLLTRTSSHGGHAQTKRRALLQVVNLLQHCGYACLNSVPLLEMEKICTAEIAVIKAFPGINMGIHCAVRRHAARLLSRQHCPEQNTLTMDDYDGRLTSKAAAVVTHHVAFQEEADAGDHVLVEVVADRLQRVLLERPPDARPLPFVLLPNISRVMRIY